MFEITSDDIALLIDTDLRALVGLLAEAHMRNQGLATASVTWGGNQDAGDGGIDVRVALPKGKSIQGFVPKRATGFQVKKPNMPPAQITKEMRPKGKLRPAIRKLAVEGGAYVIVSSGASVSDSALKKRRDTMAAALKGIKGARNVSLDYYDRRRLSTWLGSGSRKARTPSSGRGCHAARSPPTPCGFSFMRWPTISPTSCGRWLCRRRSSSGR